MGKKKTDKTDSPKPQKTKKTKPDYIYNENVHCPTCESENTEIKNGDWICNNCGHIIGGIVILGFVGFLFCIFL